MPERLVLPDVSHMAFNFMAVRHEMSFRVNVAAINSICDSWYKASGNEDYNNWKLSYANGEHPLVDTRIPSGIVKNIWRWSRYGQDTVIPCFDRPCGSRKAYFAKSLSVNYKEGRSRHPGIREGLNHAERILRLGGVPVLAETNYEADDLIAACVSTFYDDYEKIDIITGDFDLLPLADEKVSVFLRCSKNTYAEEGYLKKNKYVQITPRSYDAIGDYWSKCSKVDLPYNTILLQKMLQGDESDAIPGIQYETKTGRWMRKYPDKKYNVLLEQMREDGVDFSSLFRYDTLGSFNVDNMKDVLSRYLTGEDLEYALTLWKGVDLNTEFTPEMVGAGNSSLARGRYQVSGKPVKPSTALSEVALQYGIHLS